MFDNPSSMYADALMRNVYDRSMPSIERDPTVDTLEQNLFNTLKQITPEEEAFVPVKSQRQLPCDNKAISPEDAARELLELQKQGLL